jgi:hypothetical protein
MGALFQDKTRRLTVGHNIRLRLRPQACCLIIISFFLGLLFDPEDGGDSFLRNILQARHLIVSGFFHSFVVHPEV